MLASVQESQNCAAPGSVRRIRMLFHRKKIAQARAALAVILFCAVVSACSDTSAPSRPADGNGSGGETTLIADHAGVEAFEQVTAETANDIRAGMRIFYGHTSHGSQIITGMNMLAAENQDYALPTVHEVADDLGAAGDTSGAEVTRGYLDAHPGEVEVVMWSWCGGVSDNTVEGINIYLHAMSTLESEYPAVVFVYMTGHLDGTGDDGNLRARNNQIRSYCVTNRKVLFDFADIESYDPDGVFYPDETDACGWCADWCAEYDCPDCPGCAHSHCYNCYRKGKAFWYLLAVVLGS